MVLLIAINYSILNGFLEEKFEHNDGENENVFVERIIDGDTI